MRAIVVIFALLMMVAQPVSAADSDAAQKIIRAQEDAISRNDAEAAYSFAAPVIQSMFPDAQIFMEMVRQGYAPLVKPKSFEFVDSGSPDGTLSQVVNIVDSEGGVWTARYTLEQQPDGSLKISGCSLLKAGQAV